MQIRTHIGVSADGYVATPDGRPMVLSILSAPGTLLSWLELESQRTFEDGSVELSYSLAE